MDTEQMIRELRYLEDKYKDRSYSTFEVNWYCVCHDVANRLEELYEELKKYKRNSEKAHPDSQKEVERG